MQAFGYVEGAKGKLESGFLNQKRAQVFLTFSEAAAEYLFGVDRVGFA